MIYEKKSTKIMGVIFTILASIIFSLNIISIICTNYYLNANHVKESFLTDANHTIMRSMLVEDLNSTMEQDFPGIDFDYMVDDDMVNQYSEDVMQAILGNKYSFDTRYYENYLEDEIYPELGNRYDLELTDEQADHFHSLYMSVFNGSELATSGEDLSDDFLDGTADNLKYGMWIAAGFALMIVLFILYENKFIAVKNLGIALFTSSVTNMVFSGFIRSICNSAIMSIRKAGAGYSSNSSKFVSMIAGEFLDKYTKKPFYISACLVLIGFLVLAGGFIAMRVYRRKNMEVANYYSSSVSSGPDYSAQQGPMGDNFDREYNEMFDDGYVNPDQQIFKPLNNGNDSNDWRGF